MSTVVRARLGACAFVPVETNLSAILIGHEELPTLSWVLAASLSRSLRLSALLLEVLELDLHGVHALLLGLPALLRSCQCGDALSANRHALRISWGLVAIATRKKSEGRPSNFLVPIPIVPSDSHKDLTPSHWLARVSFELSPQHVLGLQLCNTSANTLRCQPRADGKPLGNTPTQQV